MPPAARILDPIGHPGMITGPGVPNVLIGGLPAAVMGDMCARVRQRRPETFGAERLQEVVHRVDVECSERVLIVCGRENDRDVAAHQLEHLEPVELGHLHVEKHQIGVQLRDHFHRLETVLAFGDDVDVA